MNLMHTLDLNPAELSMCATEPIQIPGAIQPHGALLVLAAQDWCVLQASANAGEFLGIHGLKGISATQLLGTAQQQMLQSLTDAPVASRCSLLAHTPSGSFQVLAHRLRDSVVLEFEPAGVAELPDRGLEHSLVEISAATDQGQLLTTTAATLRRLTGFDRVVVYRFDEDGHGEVLAESCDVGMEPYLGLHFPESDIPRQARALYLNNWIRCIPDARYAPVPLEPALHPATGQPLDMSQAWLRSVSPVHLRYLANMGVRASMSVSLVVNGRLWGLISCGHRSTKPMPQRLRLACETLGRVVSLQLAAMAATEFRSRVASGATGLGVLRAAMAQAPEQLLENLLGQPEFLLAATGAAGAAVVFGEAVQCVGACPASDDIVRIAQWGQGAARAGVFSTRQLAVDAPELIGAAAQASGVLGLVMPTAGSPTLLWFRGELVEAVSWGGNPNKSASLQPGPDGALQLNPRQSFEIWKEEVRGRSLPWDPAEIHAATELRRMAIELDLERQVAVQKAAVRARDELVAVVSHDLRTPVSIVAMQAMLLQRILSQDLTEASKRMMASTQTIQRATERMVSLLRDLLDLAKIEAGRFEIEASAQHAGQLVQDACELVEHMASARNVALQAEACPAREVRADSERVFQVLANLLGNAIKFTPDGGSIGVGATALPEACEFYVRDSGVGMSAEQLDHVFDRYWQVKGDSARPGAGLGLYICKGIVQSHGGRIRAESRPGAGSTFFFTLPWAS